MSLGSKTAVCGLGQLAGEFPVSPGCAILKRETLGMGSTYRPVIPARGLGKLVEWGRRVALPAFRHGTAPSCSSRTLGAVLVSTDVGFGQVAA